MLLARVRIDNAVAARFVVALGLELLMENDWQKRGEARGAIFWYVEIWYDGKRRRSTLGSVRPAENEDQLVEAGAWFVSRRRRPNRGKFRWGMTRWSDGRRGGPCVRYAAGVRSVTRERA